MIRFLQAHGHDPGPTQRPVLAGAVVGLMAEIPTAVVLWYTGTLSSLAQVTHVSQTAVLLAHVGAVTVAGLLYGYVFQRAANDRRGGWLFGLGYGFVLWTAGPVTSLQWILGQPVATGRAAMGHLTGHLLWGLLLGVLFPSVHRFLQTSLDRNIHIRSREELPTAAARPRRRGGR